VEALGHRVLGVAEVALQPERRAVESGCGSGEVREQACWALSNIAADGPECRDTVLAANVVPALLAHATAARLRQEHGEEAMFLQEVLTDGRTAHNWARRIAQATCNLCTGSPPPPYDLVLPLLPLLAEMLCSEGDTSRGRVCH
jgi:importin subunit alpha-1